jgi:hypothetical protein
VQVSNSFLGLTASDVERVVSGAAGSSAKPFADIRANRLNGVSPLLHM